MEPSARLRIAGAIAIVLPRLASALCSAPFYDERTVLDLGRIASSPCAGFSSVPWDQPAALNLLMHGVFSLGGWLGMEQGHALDLPLVAGRLVVVAAAVAPWLLFARVLQPGVPRAALFLFCLLAPSSMEQSSLAMNNGVAALPIAVALACFGGACGDRRPRQAAGGIALGLAVAVSYVAWPAALGMGTGVLWMLWRDRREGGNPWRSAALALGPSWLVVASWLAVIRLQRGWFSARLGSYQHEGFDTAEVVRQLATAWRWFAWGRDFDTVPDVGTAGFVSHAAWAVAALWLVLAVLGSRPPDSAGDARPDPWRRLLPPLLGLAWGTWLALLAMLPFVWMGRPKYFLLLGAPSALLVCRGLQGVLGSVAPRLRTAGGCAALVLLLGLVLGALRCPLCWERADQRRRFYVPMPLSWTCEEPWVPGLRLAQDAEGSLLPRPRRIICGDGGPCEEAGQAEDAR